MTKLESSEQVYTSEIINSKKAVEKEDGKKVFSTSRLMVIEGMTGWITVGCSVVVEAGQQTGHLFYLEMNSEQAREFATKYPKTSLVENNGSFFASIDWVRYAHLLKLDQAG